jgi:hypothetical protein
MAVDPLPATCSNSKPKTTSGVAEWAAIGFFSQLTVPLEL